MGHPTKAWNWDEGMEYVFYGMAALFIWTIINVFITLTSERDLEESEETGLRVQKEEHTRRVTYEKNIREKYAAKLHEDESFRSGGNISVSEGKVQWEELVDESTPGDDVEEGDLQLYPEVEARTDTAEVMVSEQDVTETEGDAVLLRDLIQVEVEGALAEPEDMQGSEGDDSSQRIDPEGEASDVADQEFSKHQRSDDVQMEKEKDPSDMFIHEAVSQEAAETCIEEVAEFSTETTDVPNSVMDWKEMEVEVIRENDGEGSEDSSGYEVLLIDAPLRISEEEEEECEELEDVAEREQASQKIEERSSKYLDEDQFTNDTSGETEHRIGRGSIPKIVIVDESGQGSYEPEMEEITAFRGSETSFSSESDDEHEHTVADVTDDEVQDNDETHGSNILDVEEERKISEEEEDNNELKEANEQPMPIHEYHYAKEEEDMTIGTEQTCPIADLIILEPPSETVKSSELDDSILTPTEPKWVTLNDAEQGETILDHQDFDTLPEVNGDIGGESKDGTDTTESISLIHEQFQAPNREVVEEEREERSEINHDTSPEEIHEGNVTETEPLADKYGAEDLAQSVNHDEQPIIANGDSSGESEPAAGTRMPEAATGGEDRASGPEGAATESPGNVQVGTVSHVEPEDSSQAYRHWGIEITEVADDVEKSSEDAVKAADDGNLAPSSYVSEMEFSDQEFSGFSPKIKLDDFETQPEELKISKLLSDDFISTYLKPKVQIMRPIDPYSLGDDKVLVNSTGGRNLLKNNCGQEEFDHWTLKQQNHGWIVCYCSASDVKLPTRNAIGDPLPEFIGCNTYFETVNRMCKKEQTVDLIAEGCDAEYLDSTKARIEVSEWISVNENCKSTYELRVRILNEKKVKISDFDYDDVFSNAKDNEWRKITHVFRGKECKGARYVSFSHGAVKWSGQTGCRMSGAAVAVLPMKS
ncbi:uncharacterized protein LOC124153829 [Ischnura elegans]|uniref:uncharacterized protein LOC124153829 n=1 Tax=Ischnura elegans TaxID=197161 RepID=UPI001ED86672|nr:uncharacterized protein LOC124153829 [Ischnura elegans]